MSLKPALIPEPGSGTRDLVVSVEAVPPSNRFWNVRRSMSGCGSRNAKSRAIDGTISTCSSSKTVGQ